MSTPFRSLLVTIVMLCTPAFAATTGEELAELKRQLTEISARIAVLEQTRTTTEPVSTPSAEAELPGWTNTVTLSGDLRYRHESIDQQGSEERTRHRVRARVGIKAKPAPGTEVGVRLASGSDDPISTNQSLDGGFTSKGLQLDQAYIRQSLGGGNTLIMGKMKNPFFLPGKSSLMWDSDLTPEGLAWTLTNDGFFANAVALSVEERSSASDTLLLGGQAGVSGQLGNGAKFKAGVGYYDYAAIQGRAPIYNAGGNTLDGSGNYLFDYRIAQLFGELTTRFADLPVTLYVDLVQNTEAGPEDTGISFGGTLGKASSPGQWAFGYLYKDLEADAVIGAFTDSDIGGGGAAIKGHVLSLGYALTKKLSGKLTYFISENRTDTPTPRDYNRLQADISVRY